MGLEATESPALLFQPLEVHPGEVAAATGGGVAVLPVEGEQALEKLDAAGKVHGLKAQLGERHEHVGIIGDEAVGYVGAMTWAPNVNTPANRAFVERASAKLGRTPSYFHAFMYSAVKVQIPLLHEEDLLRFLNDVHAHAAAFTRLRRCQMQRLGARPGGDNLAPQISAECQMDWITLMPEQAAR